jgi:hypothetical protein
MSAVLSSSSISPNPYLSDEQYALLCMRGVVLHAAAGAPLEPTEVERQCRLAEGSRQLTLAAMEAEFGDLGYRFDRSRDCRGSALHLTGARAGLRYPCVGLYPVQADDRRSAWHWQARSDSRFQRLQALRVEIFAVHRNCIYEV